MDARVERVRPTVYSRSLFRFCPFLHCYWSTFVSPIVQSLLKSTRSLGFGFTLVPFLPVLHSFMAPNLYRYDFRCLAQFCLNK